VVYLHIFNWPGDGKLEIPDLKKRVLDVRMLDGGRKLGFSQSAGGITLTLPAQPPDADATVVAIKG
jgi:alpha-L-fucosidase